jgi:nitrite reductase/ring-hydroxylating ferredoxin subunit
MIAVILLIQESNDAETRLVGAGTIDDLRAQRIVYLPAERIFVVATDSGFLALADDSRHVGDRVLYCQADGMFSSPDHGEKFDRLGRYFGGPAVGDLGRYEVSLDGSQVMVDVGRGALLTDRSPVADQPTGPVCGGVEDPPGFYSDSDS